MKPPKIDVDFFYNPAVGGAVAFEVRSQDGSDLSAQDILDAVAEALLYHYDNFTISPEPFWDA